MTRSFWLFGARFIVYADHADAAGRYNLVEGQHETCDASVSVVRRAWTNAVSSSSKPEGQA